MKDEWKLKDMKLKWGDKEVVFVGGSVGTMHDSWAAQIEGVEVTMFYGPPEVRWWVTCVYKTLSTDLTDVPPQDALDALRELIEAESDELQRFLGNN